MKIDLNSGRVHVPQIKVTPPGRKLKNWMETYGEYTADNEAPESYHLWTGLGIIAGAARRNVYLEMQHFDILSNMFVVLVGPAGGPRKTTALKIGRKLLKQVPGIHFTTKASSPAALIKQLADLPEKDQQSITCISYELGTFFSQNAAEMVDLATDLYDGNPDWDKQTISRGMEKITHPWFNFQAATTPQWLGDYLSPTAVEGGFVSRTIFVYEEQRKLANPIPRPQPALKLLEKDLVNDLTHISTLNGQFQFSADAEEVYSKWYLDPKRFPHIPDHRIGGYYERKHAHVLKVAMLLSLAEKDELLLEEYHIMAALKLLSTIEPGMKRSFSAVGKNINATTLERILEAVSLQGGMTYGEIISKFYRDIQDDRLMQSMVLQLVQMGAIAMKGNKYIALQGSRII